jgi:hypothetical protein
MTSRQQITIVPPRQAGRPPVVYDHEVLITAEDGRQLAIPVQKVVEVHHHYHSAPDIPHHPSGLDYVELDKQDAALWSMAARRDMQEIFRRPKPDSSETDFVSVVLGIVFLAFLGLCMVGIAHH